MNLPFRLPPALSKATGFTLMENLMAMTLIVIVAIPLASLLGMASQVHREAGGRRGSAKGGALRGAERGLTALRTKRRGCRLLRSKGSVLPAERYRGAKGGRLPTERRRRAEAPLLLPNRSVR
jgi:hypothetical protein